MLALSVVGFGLTTYLQINFIPTVDRSNIRISYVYPRADPEQVERVITTPLEAQLSLIEGVDKIHSVSNLNGGYISAEVAKGADIDFLRFEIATKIREIYPKFPPEVHFPIIRLNDPNQKVIDPVIVSYSLLAPRSAEQIYDYCRERLIPMLSSIPMLERIDLSGRQQSEWVIRYDPSMMALYGIGSEDIITEVRNELISENFAYHQLNEASLYVRTTEGGLDQLLNRFISLPSGESVLMSSIITIQLEEADPTSYYRINGQNSIRINFIPKGDANHLALAENIHDAVQNLQTSLPSEYDFHADFDSTDYIRDELNKIWDRTFWSLGLLMVFVAMIYRSWRDLMIILVSLLVNIGLALIVYYLLNIQINLYALAAITISFGIIIDNSIVVSHHFQRNQNLAVYPAVLTSTLTTVSSLLVVFFLPAELRLSLMDFAQVLSINLVISLVVCALVVPALIRVFHKEGQRVVDRRLQRGSLLFLANRMYLHILALIVKRKNWYILATVLLFGFPVFYIPNSFKNVEWYNKSFGSDYYIENVKPWVNKALGGTLRLFSVYVYEGSSYRSPEQTKLFVNASLPLGSTIEQMNDIMIRLEAYLSQYELQMESFITQITSGQYAHITISFDHDTDSSFPYILKSRLESFAIDLGGVTWGIYGVGKGFSNATGSSAPSFNVLFKGYNKDKMALYADDFATLLLAHPRIQKVDQNANFNWYEKDKYHWEVMRSPLRAGSDHISNSVVYGMFDEYNQYRSAIGRNQDNLAVVLRPANLRNQDKWGLLNKPFYQDSTQYVLANTIMMSKKKVAQSIHKEDQSYIQKIQFEYTGSGRFGQRYLDECLAVFKPTLPLGYSLEQTTFSYFSSKSKTQYSLVLLIIAIIFVISTVHFESFAMGGLVVLLIPLSYIGIFVTFYSFDFPFDQGGYTSFILVSGLAVNSIILILSDYKRLVMTYPHLAGIKAYARAFRYKSSPIYLSIASTALGLIPFTLHGRDEVFWFSLSVGTIGGLLFSIIILWLVVPLFMRAVR